MRNFQGYPYKLSLLIGSVVLAHELVSLIDRVRRLRRPKYDPNRRDFRQNYSAHDRPTASEGYRYRPTPNETYDHEDF